MVYWEKIKWKQFAALIMLVAVSFLHAQEGDAKKGEGLFKQHCAACHKLDAKLVGPALGGVVERLQSEQNLGTDWLHKWIKDNESLRAGGDEYANQIFEEYNQTVMTSFKQLSDADIDNILAYTTNPPKKEEKKAEPQPAKKDDSIAGVPMGALIIAFIILFAMLSWILIRVNALASLTKEEGLSPSDEAQIQSFDELFAKYQTPFNLAFALIGLLVMYGAWNLMISIGVDKGYQPEQPIYFSHKIHAGIQKIDCQYCHSSAKYGKVSGIPSTNVCMNCHYQIQEYQGDYIEEGKSREFYTAEMQKIYKAVGFDTGSLKYTGEVDPIEWTRIHNMPDFVYFNHAQHVVVGEEAIKKAKGVDPVCFACHGQVDEMDELQMANDFTMGWCIECHRATEVDMENQYYQDYYADLHEKLKKEYGDDVTITVDAIGGLECGKCHY